MKKLLFVINDMNRGGAETGLVDVLNYLINENEITLLVLRKKGNLLGDLDQRIKVISILNIENTFKDKIYNLNKKILYFSGGIFTKMLHRHLIKEKYDAEIAYIEGYPAVFVANSTNLKSTKIGSIRVGLKKHKLKATKIPWGMINVKKAYQKMDKIHCVSKDTAKEFSEMYPENKHKIEIIYTYFDVDKIIEKSTGVDNLFDKNKINFLAVGRFSSQKGYDRLVEAFSKIYSENKDIMLHIIGNDKNDYANTIKSLIKAKKLEKAVKIYGEVENPYPYIKHCDALISSSLYEGFPRVINEAICLQKIVIATNVSGTKEALKNGKYGFLVEDSIEGLLVGMRSFINDKSLVKQFESNIKKYDGNKEQFFINFNKLFEKDERPSCILITDIFPYNGEAFVNNEILFMKDKFKKIDVITINPNAKRISYDLPKNVFVHKLNKFDVRFLLQNIRFQMKAIKMFFLSITNLRKLIIWGKNYYYSALVIAKINTIFNGHELLYSYWFHWGSLALARINYTSYKITRAHGYDVYNSVNPQLYKKYIMSNIDYVFPISKEGFKEINAQTGLSNLKVSYLGTYNESQPVLDVQDNNEINLVSCSRIVEIKRIDLIIEILNKIDDINISWVHFGDGKNLKNIEKLAREKLGFKKNIKYIFKGYVSNENVLKYYQKANVDLIINTSVKEGIPISLMEAMSYGIVPIATNVGSTYELVEKFLIDYEDEMELIEKFVNVIRSYYQMKPEEKKALKEEAYNKWLNNFNATKNLQEFYFKEILPNLKKVVRL